MEGYRRGMMMDSCNADMMSSIPPISTGHAQGESAPGLFIKGVPENVVSMASGWMISDATFSGEMCEVWRYHLVRQSENMRTYPHVYSISSSPIRFSAPTLNRGRTRCP